ncbi:MAG: hypothetical protein AAF266_12130 [Planctomycetota bacterium]
MDLMPTEEGCVQWRPIAIVLTNKNRQALDLRATLGKLTGGIALSNDEQRVGGEHGGDCDGSIAFGGDLFAKQGDHRLADRCAT